MSRQLRRHPFALGVGHPDLGNVGHQGTRASSGDWDGTGRRATPLRAAARATAWATSGATSRLKTLGTMYSGPISSSAIDREIASRGGELHPSSIVVARASSAPRNTPGNARTLLIWFG